MVIDERMLLLHCRLSFFYYSGIEEIGILNKRLILIFISIGSINISNKLFTNKVVYLKNKFNFINRFVFIQFFLINFHIFYQIKMIDGSIQWKSMTNEKSQRFFVFI